jgi:rubrerythrin
MDVFEYALKMELDGKAYYEKLAGSTSVVGLANIFRNLAEDEQKHYDIIKKFQTQEWKTDMAPSTAIEDAQNIFTHLMEVKDTLDLIREDHEGYKHAMHIEAESERFYLDTAEVEENPEIKNLLLRVAAEERKHYEIVQNIYEFVFRPKYFLAWREFSNLDELF